MEEDHQKKMRFMKIGVILVMALILVFWLLNFSNVWRLENGSASPDQNDWNQVKDNFSRSINDLQNRLDQIGRAQKKAEDKANRAFVDDLLKNTALLASSTAGSTLIASSTLMASSTSGLSTSTAASSTIIKKNTKPKTKK